MTIYFRLILLYAWRELMEAFGIVYQSKSFKSKHTVIFQESDLLHHLRIL